MASTRTITGPIWPRAARRAADPARAAALALAILLLEVLLAAGAAGTGASRFVVLFGAVLALAFVFRFPLATTLLLLGFTDFVFYATYFAFELGPLSVRPHELVLLALLVVALVRPQRQTWGGLAGAALAAFLALIAVSGMFAVADERAPLTDVFNWARPFALLTVFYVVVRLFPRPDQRRALLIGAAAIAALAGVVSVLVALGWSVGDELKGAGTQIVREEEGLAGLLRVRLAGLSLGYALFWYVAVRVAAAPGRRLGWGLLLAGIAGAIAVSFNRNMWLGLLAGLLLMLAIGGPLIRARLAVAIAVAIGGVALLAAFGSTGEGRVLDPVVERGATLFDPSAVSAESSLTERGQENRIAWRTAQRHLLLGIGPGAQFGKFNLEFLTDHSVVLEPQLFLHNQYLYLLLIGGIPGSIAFLLFLGIPLVRAFKRMPRDPAVTACAVGIATIMLSAVVAIYFSVEDMTAVLGMLAGVVVADAEGPAADGRGSGLT